MAMIIIFIGGAIYTIIIGLAFYRSGYFDGQQDYGSGDIKIHLYELEDGTREWLTDNMVSDYRIVKQIK